jgi:predicted amidophosphoribosyltransferase
MANLPDNPTATNTMTCPMCGAPVEAEQGLCRTCGENLTETGLVVMVRRGNYHVFGQ